ncbi:unnamed protein product [marine sediment metagenome]|uniref:Ankyrin repeat protein n=1 Tax=marine sediment metagenome TaxID=412755 RepID=X1GCL7_9ZZZZ
MTNTEADKICIDQTFWMNRVIIKFPYIDLDVLKKYKDKRNWSEYYIQDLRKIGHKNSKDYLRSGARYNRLDHVKIALHNGADIHSDEDSAVGLASMYGHLDVVKYLVSQGLIYPNL